MPAAPCRPSGSRLWRACPAGAGEVGQGPSPGPVRGPPGPARSCGPTPQHLVGQEPEPPLDLVDPRRARRGEMQEEPRMAGKPRLDRGGLVSAVVVADHVDVQ